MADLVPGGAQLPREHRHLRAAAVQLCQGGRGLRLMLAHLGQGVRQHRAHGLQVLHGTHHCMSVCPPPSRSC